MSIEELAAKKAEELKALKGTPETKPEEKKVEAPEEKVDEKEKKEGVPQVAEKKDPEAVKKRKDEIQKELDRLISEKKALEHEIATKKSAEEQTEELLETIETLRSEIASIRAERTIEKETQKVPTPEELAQQHVQKNVEQYLKEDAKLPREKRREMTKEELEEFLLDDYAAAQEWLVERKLRRNDELKAQLQTITTQRNGESLAKKQSVYVPTLLKEFPQLQEAQKRMQELRFKGINAEEAANMLIEEFEDFKLLQEVVNSTPEFRTAEDGPLQTMREMKRRRAGGEKKPMTEDDEARIRSEAAENERQRQAQIDAGIRSTTDGKIQKVEENLTEYEKRVLAMAARKGITKDRLDAAKARRLKYGLDMASK